jgi:hypothetical protein
MLLLKILKERDNFKILVVNGSTILKCALNIRFEGRAWSLLSQKMEESVVKIRSQQTKWR